MVVPVACVAVLTELAQAPQQIHLLFALGIAVGGQGGARLGALILRRLPAQGLRLAFIALLLYAAARNAYSRGIDELGVRDLVVVSGALRDGGRSRVRRS